jgi:hypothetical protein
MARWYRIFASRDGAPELAGIEACLAGPGAGAQLSCSADASGWYRVDVVLGSTSLVLERFLAEEEGIRGELNTWAAWLETCEDSPQHAALMEHTIQARQLFTLCRPSDGADEPLIERVCEMLAQHLAQASEGFYQVDDLGFFAADGTALVREQRP